MNRESRRSLIYAGVFFVFSVILWLNWSKDQAESSFSTPQSDPSLITSVNSEPRPVMKRPQSAKKPPITVQKIAPKKSEKGIEDQHFEPEFPDPGQVQFEVLEGNYAVAFGDLILGTVAEDAEFKTGRFEPPDSRLWPSPVIPFAINDDVVQPQLIQQALTYLMQNTPLEFVPIEGGEGDGIVFMRGEELCASQLGRVGGLQVILLAPACGVTEILHEIMHAIGFVHEHSREDRDRSIEILWKNIPEVFWPQFFKVPAQWVHGYTGSVFDFDPESIMMYPPDAFVTQPGLFSIRSRAGKALPPPSRWLSKRDLLRVHYLYGD